MPPFVDDDSQAPKVFFLEPDPTLVTVDFLEETFLKGYECYSLPAVEGVHRDVMVQTLVECYPELLLFFTLDGLEPLDTWAEYLWHLQNDHGTQVRIGILHTQTSPDRDNDIKNLFLVDIGIMGGSIPLSGVPKKDRSLLMNVLEANQAAGRRREIRMSTGPEFGVRFHAEGKKWEESILDLSVSYFAVEFQNSDPGWDIGTQVRKMQLRLAGLLVTVEAVVALKRFIHGRSLFIFLFEAENDHHHLLKSKVNQFIFHYYRARTFGRLEMRLGITFPAE